MIGYQRVQIPLRPLPVGAASHDPAIAVKLCGDQQPQQGFVHGPPRFPEKRGAFPDLALDDAVKGPFQTAPPAAAEEEHRLVIMVKDQPQDGRRFPLHRGPEPRQQVPLRPRGIVRPGALKQRPDVCQQGLEQAAEQRVLGLAAGLDGPHGDTGLFGDLPQGGPGIALVQKLLPRGRGDPAVERMISKRHGPSSFFTFITL